MRIINHLWGQLFFADDGYCNYCLGSHHNSSHPTPTLSSPSAIPPQALTPPHPPHAKSSPSSQTSPHQSPPPPSLNHEDKPPSSPPPQTSQSIYPTRCPSLSWSPTDSSISTLVRAGWRGVWAKACRGIWGSWTSGRLRIGVNWIAVAVWGLRVSLALGAASFSWKRVLSSLSNGICLRVDL